MFKGEPSENVASAAGRPTSLDVQKIIVEVNSGKRSLVSTIACEARVRRPT
jgi:hypothetical protein